MQSPIISTLDLYQLITGNDKPLVLDCRYDLFAPQKGRRDYAQGHIPGAQYVHLDEDLSGKIEAGKTGRHPLPDPETFAELMGKLGLQENQLVVAYDDKGGGIAARAWWMLQNAGHQQVAILDGGWQAWVDAELPTERETARTEESDYRPLLPAELPRTCDRDQIESIRQDEDFMLIDSRTPERFRGEMEPIDPVAGAITGAINLPWPDNLEGGKFKSQQALRERFAHLKAEPRQNVFYCGSGVTACHNILAYYYAYGEMPALYPGSWSEYLLGLTE